MDDEERDEGEELRPEEYEIPERFLRDEPATVSCPECRREIIEDAECCPHCGFYVERAARSGSPLWIIIAAIVVAVVIVLAWIIGR